MIKQTTVKEDGRKLVYYWFAKRPPRKVQDARPDARSAGAKG